MGKSTASNPTVPPWAHFIAGGVAGSLASSATLPLEVLKIRMQSTYYTSSLLNTLRQTLRQESLSSLYKGLSPTLMGIIPARAIHFTAYDFTKRHSNSNITLSAIVAGMTTSIVTNPIWMVKTRLQLAKGQHYKGAMDCFWKILREEGVHGMYKGLGASLIGVSEAIIQWHVYEPAKKVTIEWEDKYGLPKWVCFTAASGTAKFLAAILTYPHEVLRTRVREPVPAGTRPKYSGVIQTASVILKEDGLAAFYRGMNAHLIRVVPNAAVMFTTYELMIRFLSRISS